MKKLRPREVQYLTEGHTDRKWKLWDLNLLISEALSPTDMLPLSGSDIPLSWPPLSL